jgi:hypothetical protein
MRPIPGGVNQDPFRRPQQSELTFIFKLGVAVMPQKGAAVNHCGGTGVH